DVEPVFTAAGLIPGMQYHFSIITSADDEGAVESSPMAITQDTAPFPPYNVVGSQLHEDELKIFEIEFSEPEKGQWDHFEVTAYETKDDRRSTEAVLQDRTITLPMRVNDAGSFLLHFSQLQTEYTVEVWTTNKFGRRSFKSAITTIKTGGVRECDQEEETCDKSEINERNKTDDRGASWTVIYVLTAIVTILLMVTIVMAVLIVKLLRSRYFKIVTC
ncbi:uncharacterized protein LOC142355707, partial [Convolutriloba macropyga]|uniref:uncharacterized protein LOC142355707 n=1 Tax=Convolutriloba macropyga TaxID=536237 RepID=UPI003F524970